MDHLLSELTFEQEEESAEEAVFEGMTFVITGSVEHFANRNELKEAIEARGGKATGLSLIHIWRKQRAADSGLRLRRIRETGMHRSPNFCFTAIRFRCRDLIFTMKNA